MTSINSKVDSLTPMLEKYDRSFRTTQVSIDDGLMLSLENAASSLWNSISILIRAEKKEKIKHLLTRCKLFSVLLLSIHEATDSSNENKLRVFRCYINCLRSCIEEQLKELTHKVQEYADKNLRVLEGISETFGDTQAISFRKLRIELLMSNFQISLKDRDLKIAKFYESKANIKENTAIMTPELVVEICRVIYNSSLDLQNDTTGSNLRDAIYFLKIGVSYLDLSIQGLKSHSEYNNIRYALLVLLTNCMIDLGEESTNKDCHYYLNMIQNDYSNKITTFKLAIKFLDKRANADITSREEIVMRMIMSINVALNFDAMIGCINEHSKYSTDSAVRCLDYLFINKLNPDNDHSLLEKAFTTRIFIITQSTKMQNTEKLNSLEGFFDLGERTFSHDLSKPAVSSIITLLWNLGKKLYKCNEPVKSVGWFKMALKKLISSNYADKDKIERALQISYIDAGEYTDAKLVYENMCNNDRMKPLSQLIMLRIFIHENDTEQAMKCLRNIKESCHEKSLDVLILGVTECKRSTELAVNAMLLLFEKLENDNTNEGVTSNKFPSISCSLRYTIQMILKMCEKEEKECIIKYSPAINTLLDKGLLFFQTVRALSHLSGNKEHHPRVDEVISVDDIEWFASTSYNMAVKGIEEKLPIGIKEFSRLGLNFIKLIPVENFSIPKKFYYEYWKIRCEILNGLTAINTLKTLPFSEKEWRSLQEHLSTLSNTIETTFNGKEYEELDAEDFSQKKQQCTIDALNMSYEVCLVLKDETSIHRIVRSTEKYENSEVDCLLINMALSFDSLPTEITIYVIKSILERNVGNVDVEGPKLCRWLRILLGIALCSEEEACMRIVNQVYARIRSSTSGSNGTSLSDSFPSHEIEWLATALWNQGVTNIINGNKTLGASWCKKSMQFASFTNERLEKQLSDLWTALAPTANLEISAIE